MAITFDPDTQSQYKLHMRKALTITFRLIYNLSGFEEVRIFPLFLKCVSKICGLNLEIVAVARLYYVSNFSHSDSISKI